MVRTQLTQAIQQSTGKVPRTLTPIEEADLDSFLAEDVSVETVESPKSSVEGISPTKSKAPKVSPPKVAKSLDKVAPSSKTLAVSPTEHASPSAQVPARSQTPTLSQAIRKRSAMADNDTALRQISPSKRLFGDLYDGGRTENSNRESRTRKRPASSLNKPRSSKRTKVDTVIEQREPPVEENSPELPVVPARRMTEVGKCSCFGSFVFFRQHQRKSNALPLSRHPCHRKYHKKQGLKQQKSCLQSFMAHV